MLGRAPSLLLSCHCPVRDMVCSLIVGAEAPRSVSERQCEVRGTGAFLLAKEPLPIPGGALQELSIGWCICGVACVLTKDTGVGTALGPASTVGVRVGGPAVPVFTEPPHAPVC